MAQNFIVCDREQELLPPSLREWLPEGHVAWCVIGAVAQSIWRRSMGTTAMTGMAGRRRMRR
jgi:hypothetical protein